MKALTFRSTSPCLGNKDRSVCYNLSDDLLFLDLPDFSVSLVTAVGTVVRNKNLYSHVQKFEEVKLSKLDNQFNQSRGNRKEHTLLSLFSQSIASIKSIKPVGY